MATKKEKRARAEAKREAFLAAERERGLRALSTSRKIREADNRKSWERDHETHFRFVDECPLCKEALAKLGTS